MPPPTHTHPGMGCGPEVWALNTFTIRPRSSTVLSSTRNGGSCGIIKKNRKPGYQDSRTRIQGGAQPLTGCLSWGLMSLDLCVCFCNLRGSGDIVSKGPSHLLFQDPQVNSGRISRGGGKKEGGLCLVQESHTSIKTAPWALSPVPPDL